MSENQIYDLKKKISVATREGRYKDAKYYRELLNKYEVKQVKTYDPKLGWVKHLEL